MLQPCLRGHLGNSACAHPKAAARAHAQKRAGCSPQHQYSSASYGCLAHHLLVRFRRMQICNVGGDVRAHNLLSSCSGLQ
mmetsp:Transcript_51144/g.118997  ORF Transcript_51144/g.118997 Transcript_51144/m.118997 type:complete len:80 (+) Transcript_51144:243-482(+)